MMNPKPIIVPWTAVHASLKVNIMAFPFRSLRIFRIVPGRLGSLAAVSAMPAMSSVHEDVHKGAKQNCRVRKQRRQAGQVSLVRDEGQSACGGDGDSQDDDHCAPRKPRR